MRLGLDHIGQIAGQRRRCRSRRGLCERALGLRRLYRVGDLACFAGAGVRLMIEKTQHPDNPEKSSVTYVGGAAIAPAVGEHRQGASYRCNRIRRAGPIYPQPNALRRQT
jgi:hypothetical protein